MPNPGLLAFTWPIHLEYFPGWAALLLFLGLGALIVLLGIRSLAGLGPVRQWVAIGIRLAVLLLFILIIGGIRWQRVHKNLEVMALVDVSGSMRYFTHYPDYPNKPLRTVEDEWIENQLGKEADKLPDDKIGVISFKQNALIDLMPTKEPRLDTHAIPDPGTGTDAGSAIQLALATLSKDAMHRLVLFWDGNDTADNLEPALEAAAAQHVQIDVVPLQYSVKNAAMIDRFVSPTWKRENEPFTLSIILTSTADHPVKGKLSVTHETSSGKSPLDMDLSTPQIDPYREITLPPASVNNGKSVAYVAVPALREGGVHQFHAAFAPDEAGAGVSVEVNNTADAFTFVQGESKVLYVDNAHDQDGNLGPGDKLAQALEAEQIHVEHVTVDGIPTNAITLQNYDAIIMANVPHNAVSEDQDKMLQAYVHDMGGGLVMIGGDEAFGAGGWQGSAVEKILPVDMDIPAQRQIGKGALVLVMHSCEFPRGNYWGMQCALQAISTLSAHDEVGIITFDWGGGGSKWDYPLQEKGDGTGAVAAAKKMQPGDMPDFDDTLKVALNGKGGVGGLAKSDAQFKHVIVISDGDPTAPTQAVINDYIAHKISVSTVSVSPHSGEKNGLPAAMADMAAQLKGRAYGPINANFNQLPRIFIKEATVVRRTLLHTEAKGIPLQLVDPSDQVLNGLANAGLPDVYGMVLTSRKPDPKVVMPITAGKMHDPVLAHWQTGLGQSVVFTSDATAIWASQWVGWEDYQRFWAQVVRSVRRPPMPANFEPQTTIVGDKGKIVVEAMGKDGQYLNFESMEGTVLRPDMTTVPIKLNAVGPGMYEGTFDAKTAGNYVAAIQYSGKDGSGVFPTGAAMNSEPEYRELKSNDRILKEIASRTNGHVLDPFNPEGADIFRREGLTVTSSPLPVWDVLLPFLVALILLDVATRRIAWDWVAIQRYGRLAATRVREFTTVRRVESRSTVDALQRVRQEVAETKFKPADKGAAPPTAPAARPDPKAKFTASKGVEGDITQVVGGATDKAIPPPPKKIEPKGGGPPRPGEHTGSLLEAKRRAQQQIKKKEEGD
jgi:uncharacterized membrane protein